jgi:hypothetical protein
MMVRISPRYMALLLMTAGIVSSPAWASDSTSLETSESIPAMFLCADDAIKAEEKLVYGFIDGKKTECMREYEFLAMAGKKTLDSLRIRQGLDSPQPRPIAEDSDLVTAIQRGKKNLAGANLSERDCMGIDFTGANLQGASLKSADLRSAIFRSANCAGVDFTAAYLKKANFSNANLTGVILKGAYLQGANLSHVSGLKAGDLKQVKTLYGVKMDDWLTEAVKQEIPEKLEKPKKCWEGNSWAPNLDCGDDRKDYPISIGNSNE